MQTQKRTEEMTTKALTVISIHRNLRAARYTAGHCEGMTSDWVEIRSGDKSMAMDFDDFIALAEGIKETSPGPFISVTEGSRPDF